MQHFDVLDPATDVSGSYLLEASAGTGKTFAIEHIVSRLIEEGRAALERILVVTFTRAAARELRQRIFARLRDKGVDLAGARITTIHGFCADLLRECGEEVEEIDPATTRQQRRALIRDQLAAPDLQREQLERVLRFTRGELVEAIDRELERGKPIVPPEWPAWPQIDEEKFADDLKEYGRRYTGLVDRQGHIKPRTLIEWVEAMQRAKLRKDAPEISLHYPELLETASALLEPRAILAHLVAKCQPVTQELLTYDALLDRALRADLALDFDVIIVDEFQDTDAKQWRIFQRFIERGSQFVAVGDPKQSIYAFRNADLRVYRRAAATLSTHYALDVNYRSRPSLVNALQELLDCPPVRAGRLEDSELSRDPLIFFEGESEEELLAFIAGEITQIGAPYSQFAVLIKDRFQSARVREYFEEMGIPTQASRGIALTDTRAYRDLRDLVAALLNPCDQSQLKWVLAGPFFRWGEQELMELDQRSLASASEWTQLQRKLKEEGVASLVAQLLRSHPQVENVEELLAVAGLFGDVRGPLPQLDRQIFPARGDAVHLLTTFASKGLEYGVVFALGLTSRAVQRSDERDDDEKLRLLYVALTRAIDRVYVPILRHKHPPAPGCAAPIELLLGDQSMPMRPPRPILSRPQRHWRYVSPPPSPKFPQRWLHSYTSLVAADRVHLTPPTDFAAVEKTPHTLPAGADTGLLLHRLLELRTTEVRDSRFASWQGLIQEMLHNAWHTSLGGFCLDDVEQMRAEMEFCFGLEEGAHVAGQPIAPGVVKGVIDLFFEHEGRIYLLDWKSNWLGPDTSHYSPENLEIAMEQHGYWLQLELYLQALGRYLHSVDPRPLRELLGGVYYIFLRGLDGTGNTGVFFQPC